MHELPAHDNGYSALMNLGTINFLLFLILLELNNYRR